MTLADLLHNAACRLSEGIAYVATAIYAACSEDGAGDGAEYPSAVAFMSSLGFEPLNAYAFNSADNPAGAAFDALTLASLVAEDLGV